MLKGINPLLSPDLLKLLCEMGHGEDIGPGGADPCEALERFAFYDRVGRSFAIVQTGERQAWANFVFKNGVIAQALRR